MEYYATLKEILPHAPIWMNLKEVTQSKISQSQRDIHNSTNTKYLK